jgi:hypothetical protein
MKQFNASFFFFFGVHSANSSHPHNNHGKQSHINNQSDGDSRKHGQRDVARSTPTTHSIDRYSNPNLRLPTLVGQSLLKKQLQETPKVSQWGTSANLQSLPHDSGLGPPTHLACSPPGTHYPQIVLLIFYPPSQITNGISGPQQNQTTPLQEDSSKSPLIKFQPHHTKDATKKTLTPPSDCPTHQCDIYSLPQPPLQQTLGHGNTTTPPHIYDYSPIEGDSGRIQQQHHPPNQQPTILRQHNHYFNRRLPPEIQR